VPASGAVIVNHPDKNVADIVSRGCWSNKIYFGDENGWYAQLVKPDGSEFVIKRRDKHIGTVSWQHTGQHNVMNALATMAAATNVGVDPGAAIAALNGFRGVKRRMEVRASFSNVMINAGEISDEPISGTLHNAVPTSDGDDSHSSVGAVTLYDDFAHHPTAIKTTLQGLRNKVGDDRIIVLLQFGSFTMRTGVHDASAFRDALSVADEVLLWQPDMAARKQADSVSANANNKTEILRTTDDMIECALAMLCTNTRASNTAPATDAATGTHTEAHTGTHAHTHIVIMSNKGFENIHQRLIQRLSAVCQVIT